MLMRLSSLESAISLYLNYKIIKEILFRFVEDVLIYNKGMKKQVLIIHGGETFASYDEYMRYLKNYEFTEEGFKKTNTRMWKDKLGDTLGKNFEVIKPLMPNSRNAKYGEWKMWLEKMTPFLNENIVIIGHSLGGVFLAKYLSENKFPLKISQLHIVAAPFDDEKEYLGEFKITKNLSSFQKQVSSIFLYFSKDDPYDLFADLEKYAKALPNAKKVIFEDRGHFIAEEFPEIIENIKKAL